MAIEISPVNIKDRKELGVQPGDTVRVWQKIQEKGKTRLQAFEGLVLARKHGLEPGATFTVRRVSGGVGIEKIFPLYSPMIDKIEIVRRSKVRRAKLYYIREKVAKEIKRQMRNMRLMDVSSVSDIAEQEKNAKAIQEKAAQIEATEEETSEGSAEEKTSETVNGSGTTTDVSTDSSESEDAAVNKKE